jgi:hypothetical protein
MKMYDDVAWTGSMDKQDGLKRRACSINKQPGHAQQTSSMDMHNGQALGHMSRTCSMDMYSSIEMFEVPWILSSGNERRSIDMHNKWTSIMDKEEGHAAWAINMDMHQGHVA